MLQTPKKKILILHVPLGAGHVVAAKALAEVFKTKYPKIELKVVDTLDFSFEIFRQVLPKTFNLMTAKAPFLYKWIYDYCNNSPRHKLLTRTSTAVIKNSSFIKFIKEFNPDFIISTNPLPMQLVSFAKEKNIIDILSANVCTDFGFHAFWQNEDVNYYFVATKEAEQSMLESGIAGQKIMVSGIPISLKFSETLSRGKILSGMGLSDTFPVFLIVGGGGKVKYISILKIIKKVKEKINDVQFIIVAGRDKSLEKGLKNMDFKTDFESPVKIKVFGFTNKMPELMEAADLILTKAGGLTIAECLAKGLPVIVNNIIPGQEDDNINYLVKNMAGFKAGSAEEAADIAINLFSNPEKLSEISKNSKKLSMPDAANNIADFIALKIS